MKCYLFNTVTLVCLSACLFGWVQGERRLCGKALADMLDLVCAGRGFHLGKRADIVHSRPVQQGAKPSNNHPAPSANESIAVNVREIAADSKLGKFLESIVRPKAGIKHSSSSSNTQPSNNINSRDINEKLHRLYRRNTDSGSSSVVDECCHRACTFSTLNSYCAAPGAEEEELSLEELRIRLGFTTPVDSTPSPAAGAAVLTQRPTIRPTAQINRGNRPRNPFFYVSIGNQATRSPLLEK